MESDFICLRTDLKATQRKLDLLCNWIKLKFGNDPTLPESLFQYPDDQVEDEVSLKTEFPDDSPSSEIQLVNWTAIINPQPVVPFENVRRECTNCQVCGKACLTLSLLKLHETEHCYVKVQRLHVHPTTPRCSSQRKDPLLLRNVAESEQDINEFDCVWDLTSEDEEYVPESECKDGHLEVSAEMRVLSMVDEGVEPIKSVPCDKCDEKFSDNNSLLVHKFKVHIASKAGKRKRRQYPCHLCEKSFLGTHHRRRHLHEAHSDEIKRKGICTQNSDATKQESHSIRNIIQAVICPICKKRMSTRKKAWKHIQSAHASEATLEILDTLKDPVPYCEECKRTFKERCTLIAHLRLQHPQEYMEMSATGEIVVRHRKKKRIAELVKKKSRVNPELLTSCPICGSWEKSKRLIRMHIETVHHLEATPELLDSFLEPVACEVCDKEFRERQYYIRHIRRYHPKVYEEKLASGQIASRCKTIQEKKLSSELGSCTVGNSSGTLQCPFCDSKYSKKRNIRAHLQRFHASEATEEILEAFQESKFCNLCNKAFKSIGRYNEHLQRIHADKYAEKVAKGEICPRKNRKPDTPETLNAEQKIHPRDELIKCDECELIMRRGSIPAHKLTKHVEGVPKPYTCPHCPFSGLRKGSLKSHMNIHSEERKYKCGSCSFAFKQRQGLESHLKTMHGPVTKHQCTLCGMMVKRLGTLKRHIKDVHENKRSFACHLCEKAFKLRTHLNYHIKTHSNPNGRKRGLNKEREPRQRAPNKTTFQSNLLLLNSESKPMDNNAIVNSSHLKLSEGNYMSAATGNVLFPISNPWTLGLDN